MSGLGDARSEGFVKGKKRKLVMLYDSGAAEARPTQHKQAKECE